MTHTSRQMLLGALLLQFSLVGGSGLSAQAQDAPATKAAPQLANFKSFYGGYLHNNFKESWAMNPTGIRVYTKGTTLQASLIYHPHGHFTSRRWLSLVKASIVVGSNRPAQPVDAWFDDGGRYGHGPGQLVIREEASRQFVQIIAETPAADRILIRFSGKDAAGHPKSENVVLPQQQREAIRETWRLYLWLARERSAKK